VTLGGEGCIGSVRGGAPFQMPAHKVPVVSTHGAGDMFVGALAARLADGESLAAAIAFAQEAAALYVSLPFDQRATGLTLSAVEQFVQSAQASGGSSTTPFLRMKQP
jgi:ribokinase